MKKKRGKQIVNDSIRKKKRKPKKVIILINQFNWFVQLKKISSAAEILQLGQPRKKNFSYWHVN